MSSSSSTETSELEIRAGTAADTDRILELVRLSLGEGLIPRDRAYWDWKHYQNPFGESPILLAESAGELVGLRVFMRWEWSVGGRTQKAVRAVDTATHPAWQGKGIFSRLTRSLVQTMTEEGVSFVFNTPNEQSRPGYLKMGWSSLGRTSLWILPVRPIRLARARRSMAAPGLESSDLGGGEGDSAKFASPASLLADPETAGFLERLTLRDSRLVTLPTEVYLRWRYAEIPGFRYHAAWRYQGENSAAILFRIKRQGALRELRLCDVLVAPTLRSVGIARSLVRQAVRGSGVDFASGMAAGGTPERRALMLAGFLPAPRLGPILTVRPLHAESISVDLLNRPSWRPSIGALELF
jgi:GNAT superfamily N-acetyltransferase